MTHKTPVCVLFAPVSAIHISCSSSMHKLNVSIYRRLFVAPLKVSPNKGHFLSKMRMWEVYLSPSKKPSQNVFQSPKKAHVWVDTKTVINKNKACDIYNSTEQTTSNGLLTCVWSIKVMNNKKYSVQTTTFDRWIFLGACRTVQAGSFP